ncbi:hypothetical protein Tco_0890781 [Tanacetum coccineum]|uniref:Uncharacterized protein n=1 Tax=Tanacetum coccineum TaxID=301880 RepID=A0ABQ5C716_9ASTR
MANISAGAEIVYGAEECNRHSVELLEELGFPRGVLPLKDLQECGRVRETGFVWMKLKAPYEHFFERTNTLVSYDTEMSMENADSKKIYFKIPIGVGKSFPITAFMNEEEKEKILEG